MFADFRPTPRSHEPDRGYWLARDAQPMRAAGVRGAVERYAKALDAVQQTRAQGLEAMPHQRVALDRARRSEEHTSELQSLMRISYAVFCLKKKTTVTNSV